jgi:hypothetical protein
MLPLLGRQSLFSVNQAAPLEGGTQIRSWLNPTIACRNSFRVNKYDCAVTEIYNSVQLSV